MGLGISPRVHFIKGKHLELDIPFPPTTPWGKSCFLARPKGSVATCTEGGGDGRSPPPYSCQWWGCPNLTVPTRQALLYLISPHCVFSVLPSSGHIPCSFIQAHQAGFQTAHPKGATAWLDCRTSLNIMKGKEMCLPEHLSRWALHLFSLNKYLVVPIPFFQSIDIL